MRCPFCGAADTQVKDSRPTDDKSAIRRRRFCNECLSRFTTFERIQLRELVIVKNNGKKELFDRDKIEKSIRIAVRKRSVEEEKIEKAVNSIQRKLETSGEIEIPSSKVGELVMEALFGLDQVAYVRYASVYKNFREAKDFEDFVGNINENENNN